MNCFIVRMPVSTLVTSPNPQSAAAMAVNSTECKSYWTSIIICSCEKTQTRSKGLHSQHFVQKFNNKNGVYVNSDFKQGKREEDDHLAFFRNA